MSTFEEEKYAIHRTKDFLFDLLDPKITPKVPKYIRQRASRCLKHYPIVLDKFIETAIIRRTEDEQKDTSQEV